MRKLFVAFRTFVRFLSGVQSSVFNEVMFVLESLFAAITLMWTLICKMREYVSHDDASKMAKKIKH